MRELRTCDFCGGDPRGTYEIVPPELSPTEAEQRRVVLCDSCQATLSELLEPLLARARGESIEGDAGPEKPAEMDRDDGSGTTEAATTPGSSPASGSPQTGDDDREETDPSADSESSGGGTVDEVVTSEGGEKSDDDALEAADESEPDKAGAGDTAEGDETSAAAGGSADASAESTTPQSYGKVLRLLRNRDLPMARPDVEGLAAGAYDLESHQVEAILDRAIERGDLVEDGRQIRLG